MELALVERYVEVEGGVDGTTSEVFGDNVGVRGHSSILDGNGVQRLEQVHQTKRLSILLVDAEPTTVVRRGRGLVDSRAPLVLDDLSDFVEDPPRNRSLAKNPGNVRDVGDLDRREVLRIKGSSLFISPSEGCIVSTDNPLDQLDLLRQCQEYYKNSTLFAQFLSYPHNL